MGKQITLNYEGTKYTLEFNRAAIRGMESQGFSLTELGAKPMTMLPKLFEGAFKMHHPYVRPDVIEKIYDKTTNRQHLLEVLGEMYSEPIMALMTEPEPDEGNANWEEN